MNLLLLPLKSMGLIILTVIRTRMCLLCFVCFFLIFHMEMEGRKERGRHPLNTLCLEISVLYVGYSFLVGKKKKGRKKKKNERFSASSLQTL